MERVANIFTCGKTPPPFKYPNPSLIFILNVDMSRPFNRLSRRSYLSGEPEQFFVVSRKAIKKAGNNDDIAFHRRTTLKIWKLCAALYSSGSSRYTKEKTLS
ncbi:hypothetical protein Tco_1385701 [Tanacetum coccineum]